MIGTAAIAAEVQEGDADVETGGFDIGTVFFLVFAGLIAAIMFYSRRKRRCSPKRHDGPAPPIENIPD